METEAVQSIGPEKLEIMSNGPEQIAHIKKLLGRIGEVNISMTEPTFFSEAPRMPSEFKKALYAEYVKCLKKLDVNTLLMYPLYRTLKDVCTVDARDSFLLLVPYLNELLERLPKHTAEYLNAKFKAQRINNFQGYLEQSRSVIQGVSMRKRPELSRHRYKGKRTQIQELAPELG